MTGGVVGICFLKCSRHHFELFETRRLHHVYEGGSVEIQEVELPSSYILIWLRMSVGHLCEDNPAWLHDCAQALQPRTRVCKMFNHMTTRKDIHTLLCDFRRIKQGLVYIGG